MGGVEGWKGGGVGGGVDKEEKTARNALETYRFQALARCASIQGLQEFDIIHSPCQAETIRLVL